MLTWRPLTITYSSTGTIKSKYNCVVWVIVVVVMTECDYFNYIGKSVVINIKLSHRVSWWLKSVLPDDETPVTQQFRWHWLRHNPWPQQFQDREECPWGFVLFVSDSLELIYRLSSSPITKFNAQDNGLPGGLVCAISAHRRLQGIALTGCLFVFKICMMDTLPAVAPDVIPDLI